MLSLNTYKCKMLFICCCAGSNQTGGGAGGRVAIYYNAKEFDGVYRTTGGDSTLSPGGAGTVYAQYTTDSTTSTYLYVDGGSTRPASVSILKYTKEFLQ